MIYTSTTRPERNMTLRRRQLHGTAQHGFSLVSGIFLLVVLASLGAVMMNLSSVQHITSAQDVQGTRAYLAAKGGVEWGIFRVLRDPPPPAAAPACPAASANLSLGETGNQFTVTIDCTATPFNEGANTVTVYKFVSTARQGTIGSPGFIERRIQATVSR
jgi:MSHA biogenesis protein MshP